MYQINASHDRGDGKTECGNMAVCITICVQLFAYTQFLRSHDIDACSYLKGTSVKLDNKDVVFGTSLENFLLCLGTGYSCLIPYSSIKIIWTLFEVRLEQILKYNTVASKRS